VAGAGIALVLLILFVDGATLGIVSTPMLIDAGKRFAPAWLAVLGGLASALGSMVQLLGLRWALSTRHAWLARFAPSRQKLEDALVRYRSASFLGLVLMRATPIPDLPIKLVAAAGGYPIALYGLAVWVGALPYYFLLAKLGQTFKFPTWLVAAGAALVLLAGLFERWRRTRAARASS
jgi:uncharacterized membrane protein YdjX (TVP38/TMEM64 family)